MSQQIVLEREHGGERHLYLYDPEQGKSEQLTDGLFLDDILDISADGKEILFGRSPSDAASGRVSSVHLVDITTRAVVSYSKYRQGVFWSANRLVLISNSNTLVEYRTDSGSEVVIGKSHSIRAIDEEEGIALAQVNTSDESIRQEICLWNLKTKEKEVVGYGHSACLLGPQKVLYLSGYDHQVWLWDRGQQAKFISSPRGYKILPTSAVGRYCALILDHNREQDVYLFDKNRDLVYIIDK